MATPRANGNPRNQAWHSRPDPWLALIVSVACVAAAVAYVSEERFVYFWDWNGFSSIAAQFSEAAFKSPRQALNLLANSLRAEYNLVFAIPLVPILGWNPESRLLYISALAALYLPAFGLTTGALAIQAFPRIGKRGMAFVAIAAIIVPPTWAVTMRGYPDALGAACIFCGILALAKDAALRRSRTVLKVAFWLALGITVRRHLAYASIAVIGCACVTALLATRLRPGATVNGFATPGPRLARPVLLSTMLVLWLVVLNPFLLANIAGNDYSALYASYQEGPTTLLRLFALDVLGPVLFAIGMAGCAIGVARGYRRIDANFVISLYCLFWVGTWIALARQTGLHQMIAGLPLLAVVGGCNILASVHRIAGRNIAMATGALLSGYLVVNASLIYGTDQQRHADVRHIAPVLSPYLGPLRRADFQTLQAMVSALRMHGQPVLVAASSSTLNFDVIAQAETMFARRGDPRFGVEAAPQIDSRDPLPIEPFLRARQVIVATPFQHHIPADRQQVVEVVGDIVSSPAQSHAFASDEVQYRLDQGAVARIYRRTAETPPHEALDVLTTMRARVSATSPIFRDYWHVSDPVQGSGLSWNPDGSRNAYVSVGASALTVTLLRRVENPLAAQADFEVAGPGCAGVVMSCGDKPTDLPTGRTHVSFALKPGADGFAAIRFAAKMGSDCTVAVSRLVTVNRQGD